MSGNYKIWLNYDNDKKQYVLPMNPEAFKIDIEGKVTTAEIDRLGTLIHKGRRGAMTISWSSYFPAKYGSSYCACTESQFNKPKKMNKWIIKLMEAKNPVHLVLSGGPFNLDTYAVVTSYAPEEDGGDPGTIQYTIKLREYRSVTVKKYKKSTKKKSTSSSTSSSTSTKRVSNASSTTTYTIKYGDTLWALAVKYYGNGAKYTKIYQANKSVLDAEAKKHGYSNANGGNYIWPGTKITIPS